MNLGENKKTIETTTAGMSPNGFIVQGIQTAQIGQVMQIVAIILGFLCNIRGFFISAIDEQEKNEGTVSPVFMSLFTKMAEEANFPLHSDLTLHIKEGHINGTAMEKLLEFKDYLKTRKPGDRGGKAEKTVYSYFCDAKCVLNEIAKTHFEGVDLRELDLSTITSNHILATEHFLFKESGKAPKTLARLAIGWNIFCTFLGMDGWKFMPQENAGREYKKDVISNDEVLKILDNINEQIKIAETPTELIRLKRQETAILLGWSMGLRSCEYKNANFDDVEQHGKIVIRNSKHNGMREVALTNEAKIAILELKALLLEHNLYPINGGVFEKSNGDSYSTSTFRRWLKKVAAGCDIEPEQAKTHGLRHRFAKNFNSENGDIFMLADIMGHKSIETTRKYSEATFEDQRNAIQQISNMAMNIKLTQAS